MMGQFTSQVAFVKCKSRQHQQVCIILKLNLKFNFSCSKCSSVCVVSAAGAYAVDDGSDSSMLTNLSQRYMSTQSGTGTFQQPTSGTGPYSSHPATYNTQYGVGGVGGTGAYSSHHGTASGSYSTQYGGVGGGGYFASEVTQATTARNFPPGVTEFSLSCQKVIV